MSNFIEVSNFSNNDLCVEFVNETIREYECDRARRIKALARWLRIRDRIINNGGVVSEVFTNLLAQRRVEIYDKVRVLKELKQIRDRMVERLA